MLLLVHVADRPDGGQDGGLGLEVAHERLAEGAHRAAGGQQDRDTGERQRVVAVEFHQPAGGERLGQRIEKGNADGDGEDAGEPRLRHRASGRAVGDRMLGRGDGFRGADVQPQPVHAHTEEAAGLERLVEHFVQ